MSDANIHSLIQYLHQTLGVQYLPQNPGEPLQAHSTEGGTASLAASATPKTIWQRPASVPKIIFFNMDESSHITDPQLYEMFAKIVQAMGLKVDEIWYTDHFGRSFMDFLTWLKSQQLHVPLVLFKKDPEILNQVQNAGAFDWVEGFSLHAMQEKPSLKKPTWEMLKLLVEKR